MLVPPEFEQCYCLGQPEDPDGSDSPYARYCSKESRPSWSCHSHTMAFAGMIAPATKFMLKHV